MPKYEEEKLKEPEVYIYKSKSNYTLVLKSSKSALVKLSDGTYEKQKVADPIKVIFKNHTFALTKPFAEMNHTTIQEVKELLAKMTGFQKTFMLVSGPGVAADPQTKKFMTEAEQGVPQAIKASQGPIAK